MIATTTELGEYRLLLVAGPILRSVDADSHWDGNVDDDVDSNDGSNLDDEIDKSKSPKLVTVDWLPKEMHWSESKSLPVLKKRFKLTDDDFHFKAKNSLSNQNPVEALLISAILQLKHYQTRKLQQFELPLDLSLGTQFQQKVWRALQQIPYGETISYAQLAQNIGKPTAYRAVANANGRNPFSIIIPCHRVVASDGSLGGYTGGLDKKQALLSIEQE